MVLSRHFDLSEFTRSQAAQEHGIPNEPGSVELQNLVDLCHEILEPLRAMLGKAIVISSGYRCLEVNRLVKSADDSQHVKGQAADIKVPGMTPNEVFDKVGQSDLAFDQCILEPTWVHVSWSPTPRRERLIRKDIGGKTVYMRA